MAATSYDATSTMIQCADDGMLHDDGLTAKWESVTGARSYTEETD